MNFRILHILLLLLLWGSPALAAEVVVVQGERMAPFEEAYRGFHGAADARSTERFVLDELRGRDLVRAVREARPRVILAIGSDALGRLREIREIPIVYLLVANPEANVGERANVTGVSLHLPAERTLGMIRKSFAGRRVGVIYNPAKTGRIVKEARHAAERLGLAIVAREAHRAKEVPEQLEALKGRVDLLLLLPDATVAKADALESLFLFSQENRVPVVAFAAKHLGQGALAVLEVDPYAMGRQAGEMARRILNGADVAELPPEAPDRARLRVNPAVARNLGISPDSVKE